MFDDTDRDLLINGLAAAHAKEYDLARHYLEWYLRLEPPFDQRLEALMALAEISMDPAEQRRLLDEALAISPGEPRARRLLAVLNGKLDPSQIVDADRLAAAHPPAVETHDYASPRPHVETQDIASRSRQQTRVPAETHPDQPIGAGDIASLPPSAPNPADAEARRFTCPNCGGRMVYTPDGEGLVCEYCAAHPAASAVETHPDQPIGTGDVASRSGGDFTVAMATAKGHLAPVQQHVLACKGCGAVFILPPQQLSLTCPYCESNYVIEEPETRELVAPGCVIPFKVDEKAAAQALRAWIDGLRLKTHVTVARGHGLYLPAWAFTIDGQVDWHCLVRAGRDQWTGQEQWEQRDDLELLDSRDLLVPASPRLPEACRPALAGYHMPEAVPYSEEYLASWPAETYQVTVSDASLEARQQVFKAAQEKVHARLALEKVRNLGFSSLGIIIETYNLVLLPAWLASYTVQGAPRPYDVLVNGQSAAVTGARPPTGLAGLLGKI